MRRRTVTLRPTRWPDPGLKPPSKPPVMTANQFKALYQQDPERPDPIVKEDWAAIEARVLAYWESIS